MRKAFSIIFILIICCQFSKEAFFLSWYHLNRASFTAQYCVNIDLPQLDCHGQCKIDEVLVAYSPQAPLEDKIQAPKSLSNLKVLNNSFIWAGFLLGKNIEPAPDTLVNIRGIALTPKVFRPPISA